jgi:hypothetical protein
MYCFFCGLRAVVPCRSCGRQLCHGHRRTYLGLTHCAPCGRSIASRAMATLGVVFAVAAVLFGWLALR